MNGVNYEDKISISDLVAIGWRHKKAFLVVFVPILLLTGYLSIAIPAEYRSSATLLVEAQEIPESAVQSTIGGYVEARLAAIEKRILATTAFATVLLRAGIDESQLDAAYIRDARRRISREATIIESPNPRGVSSTISFTVSFESSDPNVAYLVTLQLSWLYIIENSKLRIGLVESTNKFLEDEANRLKMQLRDVEQKLAQFKVKHIGALPENLAANMNNIDKADMTIQLLDDSINQLQSQTFQLQQQLLAAENAEGVDALREEIEKKKLHLSQARLQYTEAHPDIQALKESIRELELLVASGIEKEANTNSSRVGGINEATTTDADLVLMLKSRLSQVSNEVLHLRQKRDSWQQKKSEIESRLISSPVVEQEYQELQRELSNTKEALDKLKTKQIAARLSLQLEKDEKAERFSLVEPAMLPQEPFKPNRPALGLLGFVLAFGLGVITVAVAERYSSTINGAKALARIMGEPPLATIPVIDKM